MIPVSFPISSPEIQAAILAGKLSREDIQELKIQMLKSRKINATIVSVCTIALVIAILFIGIAAYYSLDTSNIVAFSVLFGFVGLCFFTLYRFLYFVVAKEYLEAIRRFESGKTFVPDKYKLNRIYKDLLKLLRSGQLDLAEAREILNQADYERGKILPAFILVMTFFLLIIGFVLFLVPLMNIKLESDMKGILCFVATVLTVCAIVMWRKISAKAQYIAAVKAGYSALFLE